MIVTAKYRALFVDNHQGASGMPFEDNIAFVMDDGLMIAQIFSNVQHALDELKKKGESMRHTQEVMLISIEVCQ